MGEDLEWSRIGERVEKNCLGDLVWRSCAGSRSRPWASELDRWLKKKQRVIEMLDEAKLWL